MNIDKYTDRSRGFIQSAQSLAQREGHQQFSTDHLLKVLLDDPEGLCAGLIDRAGGNSRAALAATEAALAKRPKVSGGGAGQVYLDPALARVFDTAEKAGEKAGVVPGRRPGRRASAPACPTGPGPATTCPRCPPGAWTPGPGSPTWSPPATWAGPCAAPDPRPSSSAARHPVQLEGGTSQSAPYGPGAPRW